MSAKFQQGSVKHRFGQGQVTKVRSLLTNNESLHSRHVTHVLGVFLGVEFDGDTYFTIQATVCPKMMEIKST